MKTALAAMMGIVALGGFAVRQWLKYQHQTLKYHMELAENIYFRNVNNNAGIFDYLIATAEDQECKEAVLAYHFIHKAEPAPTAGEIAARIRPGSAKNFGVNLDFKIADALATSIALDSCDVRANNSLSPRSIRQSPNCTRFGTIFLSISRKLGFRLTATLAVSLVRPARSRRSQRATGNSRPGYRSRRHNSLNCRDSPPSRLGGARSNPAASSCRSVLSFSRKQARSRFRIAAPSQRSRPGSRRRCRRH